MNPRYWLMAVKTTHDGTDTHILLNRYESLTDAENAVVSETHYLNKWYIIDNKSNTIVASGNIAEDA